MWLKVNDELPDERNEVLTYGSKVGMNVACRDSPMWREGNVTHWQTLPEPPELGEKKDESIL